MRGLFNRKVCRFSSLQNPVHETGGPAPIVRNILPIGQERDELLNRFRYPAVNEYLIAIRGPGACKEQRQLIFVASGSRRKPSYERPRRRCTASKQRSTVERSGGSGPLEAVCAAARRSSDDSATGKRNLIA
jgi:hypothetical protein